MQRPFLQKREVIPGDGSAVMITESHVPDCDFEDTGDGWIIRAELPGFGEREITVEARGRSLHIKAGREPAHRTEEVIEFDGELAPSVETSFQGDVLVVRIRRLLH